MKLKDGQPAGGKGPDARFNTRSKDVLDKKVQKLTEQLGILDLGKRIGTVNALGDLRDPSALPALIDLLRVDFRWEVRFRVAVALHKIGRPSVPYIRKILEEKLIRKELEEQSVTLLLEKTLSDYSE